MVSPLLHKFDHQAAYTGPVLRVRAFNAVEAAWREGAIHFHPDHDGSCQPVDAVGSGGNRGSQHFTPIRTNGRTQSPVCRTAQEERGSIRVVRAWVHVTP
jgi:hypothetical protein